VDFKLDRCALRHLPRRTAGVTPHCASARRRPGAKACDSRARRRTSTAASAARCPISRPASGPCLASRHEQGQGAVIRLHLRNDLNVSVPSCDDLVHAQQGWPFLMEARDDRVRRQDDLGLDALGCFTPVVMGKACDGQRRPDRRPVPARLSIDVARCKPPPSERLLAASRMRKPRPFLRLLLGLICAMQRRGAGPKIHRMVQISATRCHATVRQKTGVQFPVPRATLPCSPAPNSLLERLGKSLLNSLRKPVFLCHQASRRGIFSPNSL
jgi:hypothetical protein